MKSEKLGKSDNLAETLKDLTINNAEYYVSDSGNTNDANGNPARDSKTVTHRSDGKKVNFTDTSNGILQHKLLSNRTLLIVITTMDTRIDNRVATCGGTPHMLAAPTTKEVITDVSRISAWFTRTPRHVIRTGRYNSTQGNTCIAVSPPPRG